MPPYIHDFASHYFPNVQPQAGIINLYRAGHSLSVHRDVSEESHNDLISISLGCDGVFMVALENPDLETISCVILRLHSGDVVCMGSAARFAWHGLPQIIPFTCPQALADWPYQESTSATHQWRGFMRDRRVNLSIRQMHTVVE